MGPGKVGPGKEGPGKEGPGKEESRKNLPVILDLGNMMNRNHRGES